MASENNTDTFSNHIMRAIAETRNNKKRPDKRSITEFIQENYSTNVDFNFIEEAIEKLIKNEKIVNKPTIQSMTSHFPISNDQQIKMKLLKANQYLQTLALHLPQTHLSKKFVQVVSPYFDAMILSKMRFSIRFMKIMSNLAIM